MSICPGAAGIRFQSEKSPLLSGRVMHQGARLVVDWDGDNVDTDAFLDFASARAAVTLAMAKVDPDADFSSDFEDLAFTRVRGCD